MHFVSTNLNLPLFVTTRSSYLAKPTSEAKQYIAAKKDYYKSHCKQGLQDGTATKQKLKGLVGLYDRRAESCLAFGSTRAKAKRDLASDHHYHLAPNQYKVPISLYDSRKGAQGAHWDKLPPPKFDSFLGELSTDKRHDTSKYSELKPQSKKKKQEPFKFYPSIRDTKPTARMMLHDPSLCYRDPTEPGPADYKNELHTISHRLSAKARYRATLRDVYMRGITLRKKRTSSLRGPLTFFYKRVEEETEPFVFLPRSSVPMTNNAIHKKHQAYRPGPGHNETRFKGTCHCSAKSTYIADYELLLDRQKRNRFRRLPYTNMYNRGYCSPGWLHVPGGGFKRLFRISEEEKAKVRADDKKWKQRVRVKATTTGVENLQLYPDAKYITMVKRPKRGSVSYRTEEIPTKLPKLVFNCLLGGKRIHRSKKKVKKIAFMSPMARFQDHDHSIISTANIDRNRERITPPRRLTNKPVTRIPLSQITSRFLELPKRATFMQMEKKYFKFAPVPRTKVLVTEDDIGIERAKTKSHTYFSLSRDITEFFLPGEEIDYK